MTRYRRMAKNKQFERTHNRQASGGFMAFPHSVTGHPKFIKLSVYAKALLFDIGHQFRGKNNGDLCLTWSMMRKRGWRSQTTLNKARKELLEAGFILLTRKGGKHQAALYALAWKNIDHCNGKLDIAATTSPPATYLHL